MAIQRILRATGATLTLNTFDSNGTLADAGGAVTVGVTKADGTVVVAAGTATTHTNNTGVYTVALTAAQTLALNKLIATWACAADGTTFVTYADVVGGFYFSPAEARASDRTLADATKYPDADILQARQEVEEECERICDRAFVPRFARVQMDGSGTDTLLLPPNDIRTIKTVRMYPSGDITGASYVSLTASQLSGLVFTPSGVLKRTDYAAWNEGTGNVVVEVEYGLDEPPHELKHAALQRLRSRLNMRLSDLPDRATAILSDIGVIPIARPSAFKTGMDEVDAVYQRYSLRDEAAANPTSISLRMVPQKYSLWHGGN